MGVIGENRDYFAINAVRLVVRTVFLVGIVQNVEGSIRKELKMIDCPKCYSIDMRLVKQENDTLEYQCRECLEIKIYYLRRSYAGG